MNLSVCRKIIRLSRNVKYRNTLNSMDGGHNTHSKHNGYI